MKSSIFQIAARPIALMQLLLALFLLLRGHNEPGGGFIGGLVAASALILIAMAYDTGRAKKWMGFSPFAWVGGGLIMALTSGLVSVLFGKPFLTAIWGPSAWLPFVDKVKLGTPLIFDIGVFLVVVGITTLIIFTLMEKEEA